MDATTCAVLSAFSSVLGQEEGDRRSAERNLTALEVLDSFPGILIRLVADEEVALEVRQLAGITLQHYITKHWDPTDRENFKEPEPSSEVKNNIRRTLIRTLHSRVRLIRTTAAHIIATIVQFDWPDAWPTLFFELTDLVDSATTGDKLELGDREAAIHGVMRVLVAINGEVSDLDIPQLAPILLPRLVRILSHKQQFGNATRRSVITVLDTLITLVLGAHNETAMEACIGYHLNPCLDQLLVDLATATRLPAELPFECELLQLVNLCMELPSFVEHQLKEVPGRLTSTLELILARVTQTYLETKVSRASGDASDGDVADSDGESTDYDHMVYSVLEFLSRCISVKQYRSELEASLSDVYFQLALLLQLPENSILRWSTNTTTFLEESEEVLGCSVRLSVLDLLKKLTGNFRNWRAAFGYALGRLLSFAENLHSKKDPNWWKNLEAAFCLCGGLPSYFQQDDPTNSNDGNSSNQLSTLYARYLIPSLEQSEYPFLQVGALHCVTQLSMHLNFPSCEFQLTRLPILFVDTLAQSRHAVLRVSAVKALGTVSGRLRRFLTDAAPSERASTVIVQHLPNLVVGVVDCLSQFGDPILDDGLYALQDLLRIDPQGFTSSIRSQMITILVSLFRSVFEVASIMPIYLSVLQALQQSGDRSTNEEIERMFLQTLLKHLENPCSESLATEASLQLLCALILGSRPHLSSVLIQRLFPVVVHIAITSTDATLISGCCESLRCYLAVDVDGVLEWHDDEGNNGIRYILHVASRLLDPAGPVEWGTAAGRLVCAILLRVQHDQLDENMDLLLRGTLARLSTLPLISNSGRTLYSLDDGDFTSFDLESGSVAGARQSLLFVFIVLCRLQPEAAVNFLSRVPDLNGQPVLAKVMRLWCACHPFYFASHEILISTLALSSMLLYAITSMDARLMGIKADDSDIDETDSFVATRTRNKQKSRPRKVLQVPFPVKIYKLLIKELGKQREEEGDNPDDVQSEEDSETDSLEDANHRPTFERGLGHQSEGDSLYEFDTDDPIYSNDSTLKIDIKEHLCNLLREMQQQPLYSEFSQYHTKAELSVLHRSGIIQLM